MSNLYELTGDFLKVKEMMFDEDVDIEMIENTLDCIDCMIEEKADAYAKILQNIDDDVSGIDKEITRLKQRKEMLQKRSSRLKENLKNSMEATGKTKFSTTLYSFSIRKNGGLQPLKIDADVKDIPEQYLIPQPPKPNMDAIRKALKEDTLPFAHLEEKGTSLSIR